MIYDFYKRLNYTSFIVDDDDENCDDCFRLLDLCVEMGGILSTSVAISIVFDELVGLFVFEFSVDMNEECVAGCLGTAL